MATSEKRNVNGAPTNRVIVIGMDGATFDLIRPWAAQGHLPTLKRLLETSAVGTLRSTVQPLSPPAWTSFLTGTNPGKHGIFNFYETRTDNYEIRMINAKRRLMPSVWGHLSQLGKRVLVLNVPMTYPPEKVNGYFAAGFDTPDETSAFTYPRELQAELVEKFQYKIDCYLREFQGPDITPEETMRRFSEKIIELEKTRTRAILHLLDRERFDFAMLTFTATDRAAHHFWGPMEEGEEKVGPVAHTLREVYRAVDTGIAEILKRADEHTTVLIVSDHGTCAFRRVFYLNNWLLREGYLKQLPRPGSTGPAAVVKTGIKLGLLGLRTLMPKPLRQLVKAKSGAVRQVLKRELGAMPIDWAHSRALAEHLSGNVFINTRGIYAQGCVEPGEEYKRVAEEIRKKLAAIVDPETGNPFCTRVWLRDELYSGPALSKAPDILMELVDGYEVVSDFREMPATLFKREPQLFQNVERGFVNGAHTHDGILIATGRGIRPGVTIEGANIVDMVPTILALLGAPAMRDLDGRVLEGILDSSVRRPAYA
jgi:predicted AlkP superfamily phosphohydrolase/phosphomutase